MLTLVPGHMGGSERYAQELARALAVREDVEIEALVPESASGFTPGLREIAVAGVRGGPSSTARLRAMWDAHRRGRRAGWFANADAVHYPFSVPVPTAPAATPVVQTLHDVQHHDLPRLFNPLEIRYRRWAYDRPARRAAAVVTVSAFAKARIIDRLGIEPDRVHVAHLGVSTPLTEGPRRDRGEFVLYPARAWPHKNHAMLLRAMDLVRRSRPALRLVLTGGGLDALGALPPWVERRGHVSDEELAELLQRAGCMAFPSLYEGFGLPPLEAMAVGCPVAVSTAGALPEVCGDAAVYFDPHSPEAMARAIEEAITSGDRLTAAGVARAGMFTWEACAEVHASVYRQCARRA